MYLRLKKSSRASRACQQTTSPRLASSFEIRFARFCGTHFLFMTLQCSATILNSSEGVSGMSMAYTLAPAST